MEAFKAPILACHIDFVAAALRVMRDDRVPSWALVTSGGDTPINEVARDAMPPNLTAWHAANVHVRDPRIHPIPLGIGSDPTYGNFSVIEEFQNTPKTKQLFACFCLGNNPPERVPALNQAQIYSHDWTVKAFQQNENKLMPHRDFIAEMAQHEFVLCPPGAQDSDTHRTWEALYLGCIPICKPSVFMDEFQRDFPILIVDDWKEVTPKFLDAMRDELASWSWERARERLKLSYWVDKIRSSVPMEQPA